MAKLPILTISSPRPYAVVGTAPFTVAGSIAVPAMAELVVLESVTVQIDSQPAALATLKHILIPGDQSLQVTFGAIAQITDVGRDHPHTVTVTVEFYLGIPAKWRHTLATTRRVVRDDCRSFIERYANRIAGALPPIQKQPEKARV